MSVRIMYLKSFNRMLKKLVKDPDAVKRMIEADIQYFVDQNHDTFQFPDSGTGIGNVWKLRVGKRQEYRAIYYVSSKINTIFFILIFAKQDQANLTQLQVKEIRSLIKQLKL
ncbi:hypothetical protein ABC628_05140 [Lentilactobacillus otakiensis]|uniref:Toxin-antitoxin system, toxin component, RelE family n=1 Tax=Lentilactobacillus otakiensis DSM 19908 = JCM 15040 TaxID=1423780 RepID=S4PQC9_9LACO|nr:hypothetical protein [Lentilactobacillus otakiensis]MDV3517401.1 hypothetical protein [Lentilactobacillus otakiensis]GAD17100.1 hypothetical protein LOT_1638 [Lentilactobacillus otakiensis DSM 19908 = JCM 15040]